MQTRIQNAILPIQGLDPDFTASLQGDIPLTPGLDLVDYSYPLSSISDPTFQTIFSVSYSIEDVGSLEMISFGVNIYFEYNGNGSLRWQISSDGGTTWVTFAAGDFNVAISNLDVFQGGGRWIENIQPGSNKLQIRLQTLASSGTVDFILLGGSYFTLFYRKKLLF